MTNIKRKLKNIYRGLSNLWAYLPLIWLDRDYDHEFLTELIKFKLTRMEKDFSNEDCPIADAKKVARQIAYARHLLKEASEPTRYAVEYAMYNIKWGKLVLLAKPLYRTSIINANVKCEADYNLSMKEFIDLAAKEDAYRQECAQRLSKHVLKYYMKWWW